YRETSIVEIFKKLQVMVERNPGFPKDLVIIRQNIENGEIRFFSDPDIVFQVLLNVTLNALQALPKEKGVVEFEAKTEGRMAVLKVSDNGRGMSREESAKAFEPFYTGKPDGTGLGLSTCLHYVQALDGNITLDSTEGAGTTATISLPMNQHGIGSRKNGH